LNFSDFKRSPGTYSFSKKLQKLSFTLSFLAVITIVFELGFQHSDYVEYVIRIFHFSVLVFGIISIIFRYLFTTEKFIRKVRIFDGFIIALFILLLLAQNEVLSSTLSFLGFFNKMGWVYLAILIYFIREFSVVRLNFKREYLNPAQLFIVSFLLIILLGTLLLMLPKATHNGISLIDALFTSTSAVCVTGLIVVDTGTYFTQFGQSIIAILIQAGGLGIMTFASYFSYFFRGQSSYESQLMLKDITNSEKIGEVFSVLKKIILVTFLIEFIGGVFIYFSIDKEVIGSFSERLFFSVFHTISAFCNAGFSTLENSLYEPEFRFNYSLQLIVVSLFTLGGIGFPILFNLYKYLSYKIKSQVLKIGFGKEIEHSPWLLNLNSRIVLITSLLLTIIGTLFFFIFEYDNTLSEHGFFGKIVTAFFSGATPRTAGFNSVDTSALNFGTLMIIFLLMWIGASPASTGGGIKTSTFAITTLNFLSIAKGKDRVEVNRREISNMSVKRAFAIIALSLMVIGTSVFLIASFDEEKTLLSIAFEAFSAYSTVGLSVGITSALSAPSKLVIIATMFIGRVSMLSILIAILRKARHLNYKYPTEEILIN